MTINVIIADDQQLVRTGFRMILEDETDITVVGEATNGVQAVSLAQRLHPDVVLMDIRMPELDGIAATRQITSERQSERVRVLMLTTFDLDEYVFDALRAGASGFLLKDTQAVDLVTAIRVIAGGESLLAPSVTRRLIAEFAATTRALSPPRGFAELTERELEVFELVAQGLSNAEIAACLVIAETTVKTHVAHLLTKLDLRDRIQAVVLAYETGVVGPAKQPDISRRTHN
jgi:DNA-binding NarL/FixJ family response regulator